MKRIILATMVGVLVSGPAWAEPRRLTEADLIVFARGDGKVIGNDIDSGNGFEVEFHKDGTIDGFSGSNSDYGTWEIVNDTICLKWDNWRYAERYCAYYVLLDDGSVDAFSLKGYHLSNSTGNFDWPKQATTASPTPAPAKSATISIATNDQLQGRRLSGAEITRFYAGAKVNVQKTEDYADVFDGDVTIEYKPDGTMYGEHKDGYTDDGKWWVKNDRRCRQWFRWAGGFAGCFIITLEKGNFIRAYNNDGRFHASSKLINGPGLTQTKPEAPTAIPTQTATPPTVKTAQPQGSGSVKERLTRLKELLDQGLLTEDEAAAKRKEILKGL